jgi:hypothetical protein
MAVRDAARCALKDLDEIVVLNNNVSHNKSFDMNSTPMEVKM